MKFAAVEYSNGGLSIHGPLNPDDYLWPNTADVSYFDDMASVRNYVDTR